MAVFSCLISAVLVLGLALSAAAEPSPHVYQKVVASDRSLEALPKLSLGLPWGQVRPASSGATLSLTTNEGLALGPGTGEDVGLYSTAGSVGSVGRFWVTWEKNWLTSTDLSTGQLVAKVSLKGEKKPIITLGDEVVILRQGDLLWAYRQDNLQLLWKQDFSTQLGPLSENMACWPNYLFLVGQEKAESPTFRLALVQVTDGQIVWQNSFTGNFLGLAAAAENVYIAASVERGAKANYGSGAQNEQILAFNLKEREIHSLSINNWVRFYAYGSRLYIFTAEPLGYELNYRLSTYSSQLARLDKSNGLIYKSLPKWIDFDKNKVRILSQGGQGLNSWSFTTVSSIDGSLLGALADSREIVQVVPDKDGLWLFLREEGKGYPNLFRLIENSLLSVAKGRLNLTDSSYLGCSCAIVKGYLYSWGFTDNNPNWQLFSLDLTNNSTSFWTVPNSSAADFVIYGSALALVEKRNNWLSGETFSRLKVVDPRLGGFSFTTEEFKGDFASSRVGPGNGPRVIVYLLTSLGELDILDAKGRLSAHPLGKIFFDWTKWNNLIGVLFLTGSILWFIFQAKRGKKLFIRQIAGLNALDEAVGRATEMGKPVLYIPGVGEIDDTQTMAALSVLGHVSSCTAEYDCPIMVPNCSPVVMSMAQDTVSQAYLKAGRPDSYVSDYICYLSGEQFGFAAGVCGLMVREKPAAILYMGTFLAEALMLAETGNSTGAIQIAGTASASQLPFFVAACDYTLIGEELYAASAYLSDDPMQIGSLKGQDAAKALIMALIILGVISLSLGYDWINYLW